MLLPHTETLIELALTEDLPGGDVTSRAIFGPDHRSTAFIEARNTLCVCGTDVAVEVFRRVNPDLVVTKHVSDGTLVATGDRVISVSGATADILACERTALNFLQHLSGVATMAHHFSLAARGHKSWRGHDVRIVDTRKTIPGYRSLEKYAVRVGGCFNHRSSLSEQVMIKNNHIAAAGSIQAAVTSARHHAPHGSKIEVEVESLPEVEQALAAGAEVIMLDNMQPAGISEAVALIAGRALVEVSGGITFQNLHQYLPLKADIISVGALTHSVKAADLSLTLNPV